MGKFTSSSNFQIRAVYVDEVFVDGGCLDGHDWAIVEVVEPMQFSANVRPICLPTEGRYSIGGDATEPLQMDDPRLMIVGWGKPTGNTHMFLSILC